MQTELAILDASGRGVVVAHMPAPKYSELPYLLNSMIEDARRFRFIPEFGAVKFTVVHEDGDYHEGEIDATGIRRYLP
jgi:hypothetical protein